MKVLLTGSNGFIGHHVCSYLHKHGVYVIGLGRSEKSLAVCDEYVSCDLFSVETNHIFASTKESSVDAIIHLAADMRHEPFEADVVKNNCTGTQRLLELCEQQGISTFIQLSSLPVIGIPQFLPIEESHPIHPPTVYHVTKYMQELLAEYAFYQHGIRTISFRICSPVGEGVNPKTIFPTFIRNALTNENIMIFGKGTRQQTYIHVDDISQAIFKSLGSTAQGVYNLASRNLISNIELAQKCVSLLHSKSKIVFSGESDPQDYVSWDISIERIIRDIGYQPMVSLDSAILDVAKSIALQHK